MVAAMTKTRAAQLPQSEAHELAVALAEVSKHYELPVVSDKHMAIAMLAMTAFKVARSRVVAIKDEQSRKLTGQPEPAHEPEETSPFESDLAPFDLMAA